MKICPICNARCFEDMELCFGCMFRFETAQQAFADLSQSQEIPLQDGSGLPIRPRPRHALPPYGNMGGVANQQRAASVTCARSGFSQEGFQAEYQLVISLKPRYHGAALLPESIQVECISS
ncbi:MAG: hypothetical protein FWE65_02855 [Eggerthellaceae bacterium]|nr:hypothetical protein [Eggerthellaceae bacterium]